MVHIFQTLRTVRNGHAHFPAHVQITTAEKLNSGRIPAINRNLSNRNFQILTEMLKILIKTAIIGQFFIEFCKIFYKIPAFGPEFCEIF